MRILFITSSVGHGGAERQLSFWREGLQNRGHQVRVVALCDQHQTLPGLESSLFLPRRTLGNGSTWWQLVQLCRSWRPQVAAGVLYHGNLFSRLSAGLLGIPTLNLERSCDRALSRRRRWLWRLTLPWMSALAANSRRSCGRTGAYYLPNAVDPSIATTAVTACPETSEPCVIMVANWKEAKDLELALQVAEHLNHKSPDLRVLLVGRNGLEGRATDYQQLIHARLEASPARCQILALGERMDVHSLIAGSQVLFLTSHYEGCPNAVLEAMALGTPVVSSDVSDLSQLLPASYQVLRNRCPENFASAILRAALERESLALAQRQVVAREFSPARALDTLEALLFQVAGRARRNRSICSARSQ